MQDTMHSLTRDIIASQEARTSGIAALHQEVAAQRKATRGQLKDVHTSLQAMSGQLRDTLAREHGERSQREAERKSSAHAWLHSLNSTLAGAHDDWQRMSATLRNVRTGKPAPAGHTPPPAPQAPPSASAEPSSKETERKKTPRSPKAEG